MKDMHKNWRKRFKYFWKETETHVLVSGSSIFAGLIATGVVDSIVGTSDFTSSFYSITLGILGGSYATLLAILVFQKESAYDNREEKLSSFEKLQKKAMEELLFPKLDSASKLLPLIRAISEITKEKHIMENEKEYLTEELPQKILNLYQICEKTKEDEREQAIEAFQTYITEKQMEVEKIYNLYQKYYPFTPKSVEEAKQEQYEKVYLKE